MLPDRGPVREPHFIRYEFTVHWRDNWICIETYYKHFQYAKHGGKEETSCSCLVVGGVGAEKKERGQNVERAYESVNKMRTTLLNTAVRVRSNSIFLAGNGKTRAGRWLDTLKRYHSEKIPEAPKHVR